MNETTETTPEAKPKKPRRPNGTGRLFHPKYKDSNGQWREYSTWSIAVYINGKQKVIATHTTNKTDAKKQLETKLAQIKTHTYTDPKIERTSVRDLFPGLKLDAENQNLKSWDDTEARWRLHLEPVFGNFRAVNVRTRDLKQYQNDRKKQGASHATINRELAALKRMFTLGLEDDKIVRMPKFPKELDEDASIRKGFVEDDQYSKLATACTKVGLWLRAMFETGYQIGWRVSELQNLRAKQVDLAERMIRLEVGTTKNGEAREANMPQLLYLLIQQCVSGKQPDDFVFTRSGNHRVKDFRGVWANVTAEAGVPELLFHDLRRTAVRNMVRNGIPETVAMAISGHKTRNIFDRYNITASKDKKLAAQRMDEHQQKVAPKEIEHYLSIIAQQKVQNGQVAEIAQA